MPNKGAAPRSEFKEAIGLRLNENRTIAWIVLVVCVLLSVFAFGGGAVARERSKVLRVFDEGDDPTLSVRHSMDAYLDSAADCAQIMASEAQLHLGTKATQAEPVSNAAAILANDASGLDARYEAYIQIKSDIEKLYNAMYAELDAANFRDFKMAYDNFWGYDDMLGRDGYHALARSYNRTISGFPAGLIAGLLGQGALNTFGG